MKLASNFWPQRGTRHLLDIRVGQLEAFTGHTQILLHFSYDPKISSVYLLHTQKYHSLICDKILSSGLIRVSI